MARIKQKYCLNGHLRVTENLWKNRTCKICSTNYKKEHPYPVSHTNKSRYSALKRAANFRNIAMHLIFEDYAKLRSMPCVYCKGPLPDAGYGIDRKDNFKPYTKENSVPCCATCNTMKSSHLTFDEMQVAMQAVLKFRTT